MTQLVESSLRPGLLTIPREIRQSIYNLILRSDLNYTVIEVYRDIWLKSGGFATSLTHRPDDKLVVPWLNLLLTCKTINIDLTAWMNSPTILHDPAYREYVLDIDGLARGTLSCATWRRIPCSPAQVKNITVNTRFSDDRTKRSGSLYRCKFWGNGGPMPVVRQLYQTLNLLLHNGPLLNRKSPLKQHLKLEALTVNVSAPMHHTDDPERRILWSTAYGGVTMLVQRIETTGLLYDYIDKLCILQGDEHQERQIQEVENARAPAHWDRYGFEWGCPCPSVEWHSPNEQESGS
ncbi:hypothetical protein F5Y16DRAFT_368576 [Xylariaceae sp. FL0255]|nr:hypothetical protein F5Y16DRAFT_368576 [Xylariaceae sp. FL0255]